ncbi:RagB/SusD family nutrient uptake outer membrane protein [Dyadobacter sp. CY343]|uniref:RagB/SusD family nutrient uptake outer membrane protein n=1 Tax=Dyadobacter sp. CY343 TaxID=2907299 RepID=UPI001F472C5C|nr:RagB/SusD family nutrient uptake outer membrane protein [Dyadobacter sp. CY343]MCE7062935.1 RagB/SusD family nutrient uptake outer membrane protein [Dyadobacter sp. CY343]
MKNILLHKSRAFFLILSLLSVAGCSDLKEKPDFINPDTFYKSANELKLGVNAVYDDLNSGGFGFFYDRYVFECLIGGYQVGWEKGPLQFNLGNVNPADEYIEAYWGICYRSINRANAIIETAEAMKDPSNQALIDRLRGETLFLRAFYYYGLLSYFDDAPLSIKSTKNITELPSNSGGNRAIIDQIYADTKAAIELLPASYTGVDMGRATKWAAKSVLMKAQLWDEKWADAKVTAEDIINNSGITLYPDFAHNFDLAHENMGERIFEAQVSATASPNEYSQHSAHFNPEDFPSELGGSGWSWISTTQEFRAAYDPKDKRIAGTFIETYPTGRFGKINGTYPMVTWSPKADYNLSRFGGVVKSDANPKDPAQMIFGKAWSNKIAELDRRNSATEKNTIYIRLSDILLGHSEACNESGQGDPYASINKVRERAGIPALKGLTQATLRDAIIQERMQEFVFEQVMYPELRRKSKFGGPIDYLGKEIKHFAQKYNVDRVPKAKDYVLPLPVKELLGNPNVKQNATWQ